MRCQRFAVSCESKSRQRFELWITVNSRGRCRIFHFSCLDIFHWAVFTTLIKVQVQYYGTSCPVFTSRQDGDLFGNEQCLGTGRDVRMITTKQFSIFNVTAAPKHKVFYSRPKHKPQEGTLALSTASLMSKSHI